MEKKKDNIDNKDKVDINIDGEENTDIEKNIDSEEKLVEEKNNDFESESNQKEIDSLKDSLARLQADFANYKRRTENEKSQYIELGKSKIVNELISVVDNFERALELEVQDVNFRKGIELIYNQLLDLLKKNQVTEIESKNLKFDPNLHHAVLTEEVDGFEEGTVIDVLQKGYMIGDKVLRPAMVKVSK
ncbi:MAG: nucleotide exchange factor GrpE [Peptoniphilaceae bacterium]